jgi:hypothetical protein
MRPLSDHRAVVSSSDCTASNDRAIKNEFNRIWKKAAIAVFNVSPTVTFSRAL